MFGMNGSALRHRLVVSGRDGKNSIMVFIHGAETFPLCLN